MPILESQNNLCCGYIGAVAGPNGELAKMSGENWRPLNIFGDGCCITLDGVSGGGGGPISDRWPGWLIEALLWSAMVINGGVQQRYDILALVVHRRGTPRLLKVQFFQHCLHI